MSGSIKQKRLDSIEIQLTPKEWAIRLADEMRRGASKGAPPEALTAEIFPESLNLSPFYGLAEQANLLCPGKNPEDIHARNQLNRKLRTEYLGMRALILKVNEAVKEKTESLRTKVALELCTLYKLILDDGLGQSANNTAALAPEQKTDDADADKENEFMLDEAAIYDDEVSGDEEISLELPGNGLPSGRSPDSGFASLIENWVADSTKLIINVFVHKAAAQAVQEKYFDGHPILFEDIEARLDETIKAMEDAATTFNEYLKIRDINFQAELNKENQEGREVPVPAGERQDHPAMDIQTIRASVGRHLVDPLVNEWVEYAKNKAFTEIRKESEEPKAQAWETGRREGQTCEIPITVQGSRNTRAPQPFLEETYTAIVFPNGAVLRLLEVVTHGQIVIIQNMRLKQEAACRVVSFKPSMSVEGNVEVEFIQPAPDFWGIEFPEEFPGGRIEAPASTKLAPSMPPRRQTEPTVVAPSAAVSRIEQKQAPALFVKEVIPLERKVEIVASPAAEVLPATPEANAKTRPEPAFSTLQVETSSIPPVPRPTPEDSLALSKAIIAAYAMPVPAAAAAPASPIPPAIVRVPAAKHESASRSERSKADTLDDKNARSEVRKAERSPEPARESAPTANPGLVADTIGLFKTFKENLSKAAWALQTKDSKPSSGSPLILKGRAFAKRTKMFAAAGAVGVLILSGVGAYLWHLHGKAASSLAVPHIVSTAAPSASAGVLPQGPSVGTNPQTAPSATPALKAPAKQKQSTPTGSGKGNAASNKLAQNSTNVALQKSSTPPFQIAVPVTPLATGTNTKSDNTVSAPEIGAQTPPAGAGGQNALLGSIVSGNLLPAPPRAPGPSTSERNFVEPRLLSTILPAVYPKIAIERGDEGEVTLTAMVNEAGKVTGTKVISGPMTLRQAAANWVSMWRFEPAKLNGKSAAAPVIVKVLFHKPK